MHCIIMKMEYVGGMDLKEAIENGVTEVDVWRQMVCRPPPL